LWWPARRRWRRRGGFRPAARLSVPSFRPRRRRHGFGRLLPIAFFCVIFLPLLLPLIKLAIVLMFALGTLAALLLLLLMIRFLWLWWR